MPLLRRKLISDLHYMIETGKRELCRLKRCIKVKEEPTFTPLVQQSTPIPTDDQFVVEFQLLINEFGAMIARIGDCRNVVKSRAKLN